MMITIDKAVVEQVLKDLVLLSRLANIDHTAPRPSVTALEAALSAAAEPVKVPQEVAQAHLLAEDIESFHMAMDTAGVPRSDDTDKVYSMYGRALRLAETMLHGKLWLWKNFVNGRTEYWAFDNPYPVRMDCGDPQTLGEPCGYAIFKPSRNGRPDVPEERVFAAIFAAATSTAVPDAAKPETVGINGLTYEETSATASVMGLTRKPDMQVELAELTGCACRWDKDDNRVQTCERHQGWLDVVHEWAERAKAAESILAAPVQEPLTHIWYFNKYYGTFFTL